MTPKGLKLSRKEGQYITIGDNITIYIVKTRSSRAELVIDAPKETKIRRSEENSSPPPAPPRPFRLVPQKPNLSS